MAHANNRLEAFRQGMGLTHRQLGQQLGVHFSTACRLCNGRRQPGLALALKIAAVTRAWRFGPIEPAEWSIEARGNRAA